MIRQFITSEGREREREEEVDTLVSILGMSIMVYTVVMNVMMSGICNAYGVYWGAKSIRRSVGRDALES